jgi:nitrogen fixation protein NifZ
MMFDLREPRYPWGLRVQALNNLVNDGSHPDAPTGALLVSAGDEGEIVNVGHHNEANMPIYLVEFQGGRVLGVLEEEIAPYGEVEFEDVPEEELIALATALQAEAAAPAPEASP